MATTHKYEAVMSAAQPESHLLALPAEIRNEILGMVLAQDMQIRIEWSSTPGHLSHWPAVADSCKQLRDESLPVFFSSNVFSAKLNSSRGGLDAIGTWLQKVKCSSRMARTFIKPITIDCSKTMMEVDKTYIRDGDKMWTQTSYAPRFDECDKLVSAIAEAGLEAHQVVWPGVSDLAMDGLVRQEPAAAGQFWDECVSGFLFNDFVLSPLLREHGLYNYEGPPVDVDLQVDGWCATTSVLVGDPRPLSNSGSQWRGCWPHDWYSAWVAGQGQ